MQTSPFRRTNSVHDHGCHGHVRGIYFWLKAVLVHDIISLENLNLANSLPLSVIARPEGPWQSPLSKVRTILITRDSHVGSFGTSSE